MLYFVIIVIWWLYTLIEPFFGPCYKIPPFLVVLPLCYCGISPSLPEFYLQYGCSWHPALFWQERHDFAPFFWIAIVHYDKWIKVCKNKCYPLWTNFKPRNNFFFYKMIFNVILLLLSGWFFSVALYNMLYLSFLRRGVKCMKFVFSGWYRPGVTAGKAAGMEVVAVPSLPKQSHLYTVADEVINSLFDFRPEQWSLPPFEDCNLPWTKNSI